MNQRNSCNPADVLVSILQQEGCQTPPPSLEETVGFIVLQNVELSQRMHALLQEKRALQERNIELLRNIGDLDRKDQELRTAMKHLVLDRETPVVESSAKPTSKKRRPPMKVKRT